MKKDLLNKLQIWEQNGILGTRKYEELSRSFKEGESLITLSISLSIRFNGGKITIIVKRPFHTFAQNDGKAVCIEDFVQAMEQVSKQDLSQFYHWYHEQ